MDKQNPQKLLRDNTLNQSYRLKTLLRFSYREIYKCKTDSDYYNGHNGTSTTICTYVTTGRIAIQTLCVHKIKKDKSGYLVLANIEIIYYLANFFTVFSLPYLFFISSK